MAVPAYKNTASYVIAVPVTGGVTVNLHPNKYVAGPHFAEYVGKIEGFTYTYADSASVADQTDIVYTHAADPTSISGVSGYSGVVGATGVSGYSGTSGVGTSGYSGTSGASGASGAVGVSGYSGAVGVSGYSGVVGATAFDTVSGYSGLSGIQYAISGSTLWLGTV